MEQRFDVERPNEPDITYVWTGVGWMYLAVVLDLFSRRVVGWVCPEHMRAELIVEALARALGRYAARQASSAALAAAAGRGPRGRTPW